MGTLIQHSPEQGGGEHDTGVLDGKVVFYTRQDLQDHWTEGPV